MHARARRRRIFIGAASALLALTAGGTTLAARASTDSGLTLFPNSVFNQPVASQPVSANSANYVSRLVFQYMYYYGSVGVNQVPIFTVPANQPLVPVSLASGCYGSFLSTLGTGVPIPPGAYNTNSSDDDMIISQPSTGRVWELWRATQTNGQWSACWGGGLNTQTSNGVFPAPFGLSATGISYAATTITESDVAAGRINHAIAMQIVNCSGYVAPANRGDCTGAAGAPPEGTWFRMPANTPMPANLTPFAQMVFRALQTYGAVIVDHAGAVMVQAENTNDWAFEGNTGTDPITASFAGKPQYSVLNGMPWSQLQVIAPPAL
jgi:hypothetical protein